MHARKRLMYWTTFGERQLQKIEMASMDGKNRTILHDTALSQISALTIDYQRQVLYWTHGDVVESSNVDGSNRMVVSIDGMMTPNGLAVFYNTLYLTDPSDIFHLIKRVNVNGGNATGIFRPSLCTAPISIVIVSEQKQPIGEVKLISCHLIIISSLYTNFTVFNPCSANNGGCSHLCLLSAVDPRHYSCDCPSRMVLNDDNITCIEITTGKIINNHNWHIKCNVMSSYNNII